MKTTNQTEKQTKRKEIIMFFVIYLVGCIIGIPILLYTGRFYLSAIVALIICCTLSFIRDKIKLKTQHNPTKNNFEDN